MSFNRALIEDARACARASARRKRRRSRRRRERQRERKRERRYIYIEREREREKREIIKTRIELCLCSEDSFVALANLKIRQRACGWIS